MKASIWITAGVAIVATALYFWKKQQASGQNHLPRKESERHHLTNIFSKAKQVAIGN